MQTNESNYNLDKQTSNPQQLRDVSPPVQESAQGEKSNKWLVIGVGIFALVILGIAGTFVYQRSQLRKQAMQIQPTPTPQTAITSPIPTTGSFTGWKTYTSDEYGFSLKYPSNWELKEITSRNGQGTNIVEIVRSISSNNFSVFSISVVEQLNTQGIDPETLKEYKYDDWAGVRSASIEGEIEFDATAVLKVKQDGTKYQASWIYMSSGLNNFSTDEYLNQILSTFKFTY